MQYLVIVGAIINLLASYVYIKDTLQGKTKPNRVTWFLWSLAPFIATAAAITEGVSWAVLPVFMSGCCPFLILLASFVNKGSYWKLSKFDYSCGIVSLLAIALWWLSKEPVVAMIFAIMGDALAGIPTIKKAWVFPETESRITYIMSLIAVSTSFFAVKSGSFLEIAFPIYLVLMISTVIFVLYRKKIFLPRVIIK